METRNPLLGREKLRRDQAPVGRVTPGARFVVLRDGSKPGEPHGRRRGATNPHGLMWRKPSQSGRTARADQVRDVAIPNPRQLGIGTHEEHDGGAVFEKPQERSLEALFTSVTV